MFFELVKSESIESYFFVAEYKVLVFLNHRN